MVGTMKAKVGNKIMYTNKNTVLQAIHAKIGWGFPKKKCC